MIFLDLDFFPDELQVVLDPKRAKKSKCLSSYQNKQKKHEKLINYSLIEQKQRIVQDEYGQLEALLNAEGKEGDEDEEGDDGEKKEGEDAEEEEEEYEDEEELVDDNDYGQNYFDNGEGDDVDDDGDGEDAYS